MDDDNVLEFKAPKIGEIAGPSQLVGETPPINVTFTDHDGTVVGAFTFDRDTRKWAFEGDMEKSAEKFIHFLTQVVLPPGA